MSGTAALVSPAAATTTRRRSGFQLLRGFARADFIIGVLLVAFWAFCAIFPDVLTSTDPTRIQKGGVSLLGEPMPPGTKSFLLGTDALGRDFFSRIVHGARVAMTIAIVPNVLALALATVVGVTAGVMRGKVEFVLMRITESIMVLPGFLVAMAVISTFGTSTAVLILTLVAFSWTYGASSTGRRCASGRCCSSRRRSPSVPAGGGSQRCTSCPTCSRYSSSTSR